MPIPYLGSKRKSAGMIYQTIANLNPNANILVDLFCGGFAVGEYFYKQGWQVIANDKNKYVIELLKKAIFEGLDKEKIYEFVDREKFFNVLKNPGNYEKWYVGYIMCIWSFGNNQVDYLYGQEVEKYKKAGHELIINKNKEPILKLFPNLSRDLLERLIKLKSINKRKLALGRIFEELKKRILNFGLLSRFKYLQVLQQVEHLERLQKLEQLKIKKTNEKQRLFFNSQDYQEVNIPKDAIIYCDPPYEGRTEYKENDFNHDEFWQWAREKSKTNKIYISEYKAPFDFKLVLRFPQKSTFSGGTNKHQPDECLFTI